MKTEINEENGLKKETIKSFIYLDTNKMYSISSQIFKGLTEYILTKSGKSHSESESQKEFLSGNQLGDIIVETQNHEEKRFLHDFAYNLFEEKLSIDGRILNLNIENFESQLENLEKFNFIKVSGRIVFNDAERLEYTLKNFNDIGYAIGYASLPEDTRNSLIALKESVNNTKDRNDRAKVKNSLNNKLDLTKHFTQQGLQQDKEWLNQMAYVLNFGYSGQFEVQLPLYTETAHVLFSAILERSMLKESDSMIIKKYSRETEKEFTIFGIPTQVRNSNKGLRLYDEKIDGDTSTSMKQAIMDIVTKLTGVEKIFVGKLPNEYVIDPIAVYIEI